MIWMVIDERDFYFCDKLSIVVYVRDDNVERYNNFLILSIVICILGLFILE